MGQEAKHAQTLVTKVTEGSWGMDKRQSLTISPGAPFQISIDVH